MFNFFKFYRDTLQRVDKITSFAFSLLAFKYSNSVLNCFTSVAWSFRNFRIDSSALIYLHAQQKTVKKKTVKANQEHKTTEHIQVVQYILHVF